MEVVERWFADVLSCVGDENENIMMVFLFRYREKNEMMVEYRVFLKRTKGDIPVVFFKHIRMFFFS